MSRRRESFHPDSAWHARLRAMVDEHLGLITRVLRRAGVPPSEVDDEVQRIFIVVARRLDDVQVGSERSFLFQVAHNMAFHARRRIKRCREILDESPPERIDGIETPEALADRKQTRTILDGIIGSLPEPLRLVLTLHEFEEMNLTEIAQALRLPRGTAASRLRRARAQLRDHVAASELARDLGVETSSYREPMLLRRERVSSLQRALLVAGTSQRASRKTSARILAVLGLAAARAPALTR